MTTEADLLARHKQSLSDGKDACAWLARNADPLQIAPRGRHYKNLRKALNELEGTCRQMSMYRSDARWTKLGFVYARAMRTVQAKFVGQRWSYFKELIALFDLGLKRMDELANVRTGRTGPILPKRTDWLVLPDQQPATPLWTPQGRMMN